MKKNVFPYWYPPAAAGALLAIALAIQPLVQQHAQKLRVSPDSGDMLITGLVMVLVAATAFLVGRRAPLKVLSSVQPKHWFVAALALAASPSLIQWAINGLESTNLGFIASRIDLSKYSFLLYLGGVAALSSANAGTLLRQQGLLRPVKWNLLGFNAVWIFAVMTAGPNYLLATVWLLIVVCITRRTSFFSTSVVTALALIVPLAMLLLSKGYLWQRVWSGLVPLADSDALGRGFVASQVRKSLAEAGWFGSDTVFFIPVAEKFQLAVIGSNFGWLAMAAVVILLVTLLAALYSSLSKLPNRWASTYGMGLLALTSCYFAINLLANLGWLAPAASPFFSGDPYPTACLAFLIGISMRHEK